MMQQKASLGEAERAAARDAAARRGGGGGDRLPGRLGGPPAPAASATPPIPSPVRRTEVEGGPEHR